jgi:hypothetical protein
MRFVCHLRGTGGRCSAGLETDRPLGSLQSPRDGEEFGGFIFNLNMDYGVDMEAQKKISNVHVHAWAAAIGIGPG